MKTTNMLQMLINPSEKRRKRSLAGPSQNQLDPSPEQGPSNSKRPARKTANVNYTGMAEDEEGMLTDSEDDYVQTESEDEEPESESEDEEPDSESEEETAGKEEKIDIKEKRKRVERIPEDDGLDGDSAEVSEQLYLAKVELRNMMELRKNMRGQVISSKYIPDQEDMQLIEQFLCAPTMEEGSKWRINARKQDENIKQMVKSGKLPGKKTHPAREAVAYTVINYKVGRNIRLET